MAQPLRSIGQVLSVLKPDFPEVSISKIRFLESEGLISPERAPSGYRRYALADVERLRFILGAQKNQYLPLKVIREQLDLMDRGLEPAVNEQSAVPAPVSPVAPLTAPPQRNIVRLTRRELIEASGLSDATLTELERQMIIKPRRGTVYYGREALAIAVVARKLTPYGMDARHLRAIMHSAEREVGLIEAAVAPYARRSKAAREVTQEVTQLVMQAHAALMHSAMDH